MYAQEKIKTEKNAFLFVSIGAFFLAHFVSTPFDEFLQKLVWIQFKVKIRPWSVDFFYNSYSFFFSNFQNVVKFRKFENRENSPFCVETKIYDKKTRKNLKNNNRGCPPVWIGDSKTTNRISLLWILAELNGLRSK